jgi:hypothetical protein
MTPPNDAPPQDVLHHPSDWPAHPAIEPHEPRNLVLLAVHQIVLRVGWLFKTESVIVPAFVDQVAGQAWIRGCLPMLSRLGQGVPPLFSANYLKALRWKKGGLAVLATAMGLPFLALSVAWFAMGGDKAGWMPGLFLALYFVFFVLYGLYLVSFGTVQGKLIRPARRGRLIVLSTFWGAIPATLIALWLMPGWLKPTPSCWGHQFGFVAACFFLSGLMALMCREPRDAPRGRDDKQRGSLADTLGVLRTDSNLRRLVLIAILFASGLIIYPHYQALGRTQALPQTECELAGVNPMVWWVVTQNVAVAIFSLLVGPLADRCGYRLVVRLLIFGSAVAPAVAVSLARLPNGVGADWFWLVYVPLGITPLVPRTLLNYALEICEPAAHARYQSIVTLSIAIPFVLSPLAGWLIDVVNYESVFLLMILLVFLSGCLTFCLDEPRQRGQGGVHRDEGQAAVDLDG